MLLTQIIAVREIGSTFFSTELVLLGAVLSTLVGPSLGYALSHRIGARALALWGGLSVTAHLLLPVGLRALVGAMSARGFEGLTLGLCAVSGGLLWSGFYAVFLPRAAGAPQALPRLYAAELAGALFGLALAALSPSFRVTIACAFVAAGIVLHLGLGRRLLSVTFALAAAAMVAAYPRLDRAAAAVYFAGYHGLREPTLVETEYSPYQRIDVLDDARGRRSLYLDGVPFYRSGALDAFNIFLAEVPGALRQGRGPALVLGSGSFSSAAHLHRLGYEVTVVELDAAVARIGFARFGKVHGLAPGDVRLEIADGRRFLAETPLSFAVIALDVPAPYHVRTALLHTPSFYRLVRARLAPDGIAALSLCDDEEGAVGRAIAAAAIAVFPEVVAIHSQSVGLTLLYAGAPLPFSKEDVAAALLRDPRGGYVRGDDEVRALIGAAPPLEEARLMPVLSMARGELEDAFRAR